MLLACGLGLDMQAQQINGDFDTEWVACYPYQKASSSNNNQVGTQPQGWKVSNVYYMGSYKVADEIANEDGKAVQLKNIFMGAGSLGQNAPGYLTLGTPWCAAKALPSITEKDGGTFGGASFSYLPDAVSFQYKRTRVENSEEAASVVAYLWKGSYTSSVGVGIELFSSPKKETMTDRDRDILSEVNSSLASGLEVNKSDGAACIAYINTSITDEQTDWQTMTLPFTYVSNETPEKLNLIFSSADYFGDRDNIVENNTLSVDNVKLLYYSELASLTYDGQPVEVAEKMDLSDKEYDEMKLACTSNGRGATIEKSFNKYTGVLTITVKGNDWTEENQNQHVYTVQFAVPAPEASEVAGTYNRWLTVAINGEVASESTNDIFIEADEEGSYTLQLNNFTFGPLPVGNIVVPGANAVYKEDGSIDLKATANVTIDLFPEIPLPTTVNLNLAVKDGVKVLTGEIDIDFSLMSMAIKVTVGDKPFQTALTGDALKVTGEITSAAGAGQIIPADDEVFAVDLTEATIAADIKTSDFTNKQENTLFYVAAGATLTGNNVVADGTCASLVLTDGAGFCAPSDFTATALTFSRTLTEANYATLVLPFDVAVSDLAGEAYTLTDVDGDVLDFTTATGTIQHDTPFLFLPEGTALFKSAPTNVQVYATSEEAPALTVGNVSHVGTYTTQSVASEGSENWYGYSGGEFVRATKGTIPPFHTAIKVTGAQATQAFRVSIDGQITSGIASDLTAADGKADVYTLSGTLVRRGADAARALEGLPAGVYIVNGKKIVK